MDNNVPTYPNMFSSDQIKNIYSNFTNGALPGTSYYGIPVNAGTGAPISGYSPPAAPSNVPGTTMTGMGAGAPGTFDYSKMGQFGPALQELMGNYQAAQAKLTPQQQYNQAQTRQIDMNNMQQLGMLGAQGVAAGGRGMGASGVGIGSPEYLTPQFSQFRGGAPAAAPAASSGAPDPFGSGGAQSYLSALANPDKVYTPGIYGQTASYQPSSGGIDAIMGQLLAARGGSSGGNMDATGGMSMPTASGGSNNGFLNALAALRGTGRG